jgi:AcrR family transcriptional regulator
VLQAVDDLLVEVGYAAMNMKRIAHRAGVSRQTVYRWWSTKAEILLEACVTDAHEELTLTPARSSREEVLQYLRALVRFLTDSPAGVGYRALVGEAQHDPHVASLLADHDVLGDSAREMIERAAPGGQGQPVSSAQATALLVGPVFYWVMTGRAVGDLVLEDLADAVLDELARLGR